MADQFDERFNALWEGHEGVHKERLRQIFDDDTLYDSMRAAALRWFLVGVREAGDAVVALALDQIDKGGPGTKATRVAWNMACTRVGQEICKMIPKKENNG